MFLSKSEREVIVNMILTQTLSNYSCSICGLDFTENDKDAICSGKNPLTFAHENCWITSRIELEDVNDCSSERQDEY